MNSMLNQIHSLPSLIRESTPLLDEAVRAALEPEACRSMRRLFVAGCGDSHHAALSAEHALETLSGLPCEPMTALQFARYAVGVMPESNGNCFIGVSVSGEVARTVEALRLARQAGATTIALTATPGSRIAQAADRIVSTQAAPFPDPPGTATPGVRSYVANTLALVLIAVRIGEARGRLTSSEAGTLKQEIVRLADAAGQTIAACAEPARALAADWVDASDFVFCGGGPNYGTALFCAAKLLEAVGDAAVGQDMEEWAHLQYFARAKATPTFLISAGDRDLSRAIEVAIAARTIGRRVVAICPPAATGLREAAAVSWPLAGGVREMFTPLIAAIPAALFAAHRADLLGEPFFRGFGGGRSREGGGGASRIRTSEMQETVRGAG